MRAKVFIKNISEGILSYNYQYVLASMLYEKLAVGNIKLADETHFRQGFKFYNFSNLIFENHRPSSKGLAFEDAYFILTSPGAVFIKSFTEGLLQEPEFNLYKENFVVTKIEILKGNEMESPCTFKTLSPVFVKTLREKDGELVEWELYPKDGKFYENVHKNLVKRYTKYYGNGPTNDHFEIVGIKDFKPKRIVVGSGEMATPRRCSLMTFTVEASEELLQFAYDAGIGEKNAMGFGCLEVVDGKN
ncbi:MAG: CRISPR-associated endoribonuclease Cas6 [Candidatus Thermoplasmatota archaeon]|nr:CRISPR-associated endoribonuclease Cas6 [Candidatus Thermoplasmatota archaeon]